MSEEAEHQPQEKAEGSVGGESAVSPAQVSSTTHFLDELSDAELVKTVEEMQTEVRHLELENQVFENFLLQNDPGLLQGMSQILDLANKIQSQGLPAPLERRVTEESIHSGRRTESIGKLGALSIGERGPRINLSQKTDMAAKEMEDMQAALEEFIKKSHRQKCNLKAELEEIGIREAEVMEARNIFEQRVVIEGVDALTQRIPAEKYIRYMEEWLKSAESTIGKMRLRISTLKSLYKKFSAQLIQKEELGEAIDAVDFDQLRIENKHLAERIDQKNNHLLELKRMTATASLVLAANKKYLTNQVQKLQDIKDNIKTKEQQIIELDTLAESVEKQVDKVRQEFDDFVDMTENYRVPDVMEYVKLKAEFASLNKSLKMWERRNHIQNFALNTCIRHMKNLTGLKNPSPSWFEKKEIEDKESLFSFDDVEEENGNGV